AESFLYYNAGVDPDARELSPGVLMIYAYVARTLATRKRRMDFLRGDESYKYEWGAEDEPIQRLLVRRTRCRDATLGPGSLPRGRRAPVARRRPADPRRGAPRDGHQRRRAGAPLLA